MTRSRRGGWLVLALAASTASCGLVFSLDGYEGPADAGTDATNQADTSTVGDAGGERSDGGAIDSSSPAIDGPGVDGAGKDAGAVDAPFADALDAGTSEACPGHPTALFCDDFDHGPLGATWNTTPTTLQTTLSLSDAASSPPSSMSVAVWADASPSEAIGFLANEIDAAAPSKLRVSFDFSVSALALRSAQVSIVGLTDGITLDTFYLRIVQSGGSVAVEFVGEDYADGGENQFPLATTEPFGAWVRAILELSLGSTPTFTLTLENPPGSFATPVITDKAFMLDVAPVRVVALAGLDALVFSVGQPSTCSFLVDNVVVESE